VLAGDGEVRCDRPVYLGCAVTESGRHEIVVDTEQALLPLSTLTTTRWRLDVRLPRESEGTVAGQPMVLAGWYPRGDRAVLRVGYQPGTTRRTTWRITAWASYDDGSSWVRVHDDERNRSGVAEVPIREHDGFVSLRVRAEDEHGNAVDQTVIRAYRPGRS
jgi:hypothetical protein